MTAGEPFKKFIDSFKETDGVSRIFMPSVTNYIVVLVILTIIEKMSECITFVNKICLFYSDM